jgi:protein-tyrosine-phosphatase
MTDALPAEEPLRIGFVCVKNAGRSQMAMAFAERERASRGLAEEIELMTGGTHPADHVHEDVVETMAELDVDLAGRTPRAITDEELASCDVVATMGCSTLELEADTEVVDWALDDPDGEDPETVRTIREAVRERVETLFDDLSARMERVDE